jgi:hypothetical protein
MNRFSVLSNLQCLIKDKMQSDQRSGETCKKGANIVPMLQSLGNRKVFKVSYFCQLSGAILLSSGIESVRSLGSRRQAMT